jgi:ribosomal-protein-alanine N-acetyltransferase
MDLFMNEIIKPIVKTDRLLLREVAHQDIQKIYNLYSLPESARYEYWDPIDLSKANRLVGRWIRDQKRQPCPAYHFIVLLKTNKSMVGICGLEIGFNPNEAGQIGHVGYRYFPEIWGNGYATEALSGVVKFAFAQLTLHKIESGCVRENKASARVLEKVGFRLEGCRRKSFLIGQTWHDFMIYGILRDDLDCSF